MLDLVAKGEVAPLVSHEFPFHHIGQAMGTVLDPEEGSLKVIASGP